MTFGTSPDVPNGPALTLNGQTQTLNPLTQCVTQNSALCSSPTMLTPDQLALIHDSPLANAVTTFTYAELLKEVQTLAAVMADFCVTKGDRVILYMPMVQEAMVAMLASNAWQDPSARRWAWAVAALGVALNVAVVAANAGHMPQSQAARVAAGASAERVAGLASEPGWRNVAPMTSATRLAWLGDILPEPAWLPLHNVMSVGDLLLAGGLAGVMFLTTSPARRLRPTLAAS